MKIVEPQVFHVAQTGIDRDGLQAYLSAVEASDWTTDAPSDAETLVEVMGRTCYRSFKPGLNKNVTKVREGSDLYLANILGTKHGSVIEHAYDSYIFLDVSRVFTHELVRHRQGTAFSQESLRYVRLSALKMYFPKAFREHSEKDRIFQLWQGTVELLENAQVQLSILLNLDEQPFSIKKKLTSAMRRIAPIGLATTIGFTANHRAMRFIIEQRTHASAEEEIRVVFYKVFQEQQKRYPNLYADAEVTMQEGLEQVEFKNKKV